MGLTIGHLTRPQRPFRVARYLLTLARDSACCESSLSASKPADLAISCMVAGWPNALTASISLAMSALTAAASRVALIEAALVIMVVFADNG